MAATSSAHIYCRVSSQGQEDGYSLATQETACRSWCAERGLAVASVAREVWSGGDRHRPELDKLLAQLTPGDVVLAHSQDRLSRGGQMDTALIVGHIWDAGATLELVTEEFEQSETGALIRNVRAFSAALHLEKIREATQRGRRARVAAGKPIVSPKAPYGYQWRADKDGYDLDPMTAPVVRMIFDWALDGVTLRGICSKLMDRGIASPTGNPKWTPAVIRNLLLRPIYTGSAVAYRKRAERKPGGGYRQRPGRPDEWVTVPNVAEAIVTPDEQTAVAARMEWNQAHSTRNNRDPGATLLRAGIARCGHCGWSLAVAHPPADRPGSAPQYRCVRAEQQGAGCPRPTIAASLIDDAVWAKVAAVLRDPDIIAREVERRRTDGGLERDLTAIERLLAGIAEKQANTARAITAVGDDSAAAPLIAELKALAAQKTAAENERTELQQRITNRDGEAAKVKALAEWCATIGGKLDNLSYDKKRLALEALGVQVMIYRPGAVNSAGEPYPRWEMTMAPHPPDRSIVYPSTRR
jgi:site-specific DNA recombinase